MSMGRDRMGVGLRSSVGSGSETSMAELRSIAYEQIWSLPKRGLGEKDNMPLGARPLICNAVYRA